MKRNLRCSLRAITVLVTAGFGLLPAASAAADTPAELEQKRICADHHETAQVARNAGRMREALDAMQLCSQLGCPAAIREDCVQWFQETKRAVPSVVVTAQSGDSDLFEVRVSIDGRLVTQHLDGKPLELDPGSHMFRFESAGFAPVEKQILIVPGEKLRTLAVTFDPPTRSGTPTRLAAPAVSPAAAPTKKSTLPTMIYVAAGGALLGAAGFAGFGLWGLDQRSSLQSRCEPVCSSNDVSSVRTKFILADASLGVALASTVTAAILYFSRPVEAPFGSAKAHAARAPFSLRADIDVNPTSSAGLRLRGEF
ncbi:MAG: hypothetical protein QM756_06290 [Polyangiaceae bacterium]